ncbi:hypothetical protein NDU88_001134 [Pleurodeles waltl]|uniref:Uncharacterized protein n=1 Tax=Pleurodeles waltl TaxID=8319 RepID=A0AAV7Q3E5_PLEWA|nr:hypothetical protein NDU88_001134 [Pleurodeles waltl]
MFVVERMEWGGCGELEEGVVGVDQGGEQADTGVGVLSYLNKLQGNSMLFDELYYKNFGDDYISSLKPLRIRLVFESVQGPSGENIQKAQELYKTYVDFKKGARDVGLKKGDVVRVKLPGKVKKGDTKFSEPKTVLEVYKNSAKLSDGRVWHMSRAKLLGDAVGANSTVPMKNYLWLDPVYEDTFSGAANILEADSASEDVMDNYDIPAQEVEVSKDHPDNLGRNVTYRSRLGRMIKKPLHLKDYIVN